MASPHILSHTPVQMADSVETFKLFLQKYRVSAATVKFMTDPADDGGNGA